MERRTSTWVLLCLLWSGVAAIQVTIPQSTYEFARDDNVTLPCTFKPSTKDPKQITITWSAEAEAANAKETAILIHYHPLGITDVKASYGGRASIDLDIKSGKANLKLFSISLAENKVFECRVLIPYDDEGQPAATTRLVVLVAPSTPICEIQGKAEYGQNINLTCVSKEGSPPPTYKWESRDVRNMPRVQDPRTTDKGGILSLYNISKDTSGYYICTSSNKIRSATCNITLSVMPPSANIGSTAAIIGGVVAFLILLTIIIYCCCCRKKKQNEEYAMGEHEYHDNENGDAHRTDEQKGTADSSARSPVDHSEERSERDYDKHRDYDDRRTDYDDRRSDYDDRRRDYDDRRSDYDDRRSDYDDRRSDYDDRRRDYDDRRSDYDDRRSDYDDRRERYDDNRRYNDRRDRRYDDDDRERP